MTNFDRLLLTLIDSFQGERTVSAVFHLLNGKRSGQTLQDVEYYNLKTYFSILPKLKKEWFEKYIENLVNNQWLKLDQSIGQLTAQGKSMIVGDSDFRFNGWEYRGKEWEFFYRLSLVAQTLSYAVSGDRSFIPVQKDEKIQQFVRGYLTTKPYSDEQFIKEFKRELTETLSLSGMDDKQKSLLVHRLAGNGVSGWTWRQMADQLEWSEMDIYCRFIEALHIWLDYIWTNAQSYPLLEGIAYGVKTRSHLTASAERTSILFSQGYKLEQISKIRKLKISTIEDHFVEMAINEDAFPITDFLEQTDYENIHKLVKELQTKKLKLLKERLPELSYFQLRLGLAYQGGGKDE